MLAFFKQTVSETIGIISTYMLIMYSLGSTMLITVAMTEKADPMFFVLLASSLSLLVLRHLFQSKLKQVYKKWAISARMNSLVNFFLSFSLSLQILLLISPELNKKFPGNNTFIDDMSVETAKYFLATVVGTLAVSLVLILLNKEIRKDLNFSGVKLGMTATMIGMILFGLIGSRTGNISAGWYGIPESTLYTLGRFCLGSIPIFQLRLLFLSKD